MKHLQERSPNVRKSLPLMYIRYASRIPISFQNFRHISFRNRGSRINALKRVLILLLRNLIDTTHNMRYIFFGF